LSTQDVDIRARNDPAAGRSNRAGGPAAPARPGPDRLPRPPGRRRPGLAVVAVLLIVLGAAVAGLLALRIDDRTPVLVAQKTIAVGEQITADDLSVARMATEGVAVIPADQAASVVGRYANQEITPGRLIDTRMLSGASLLTPGQAAVGIALQAGKFPAADEELRPGDVVQVVRAVDGAGKVIAAEAVVASVQEPAEGTFGSNGGDTTVVTVVVSDRLSPDVAAAAMANQVGLVLLRRGEPAGGG
jgi:hypothetical protein